MFKTIASETVYQGRVFNVRRDQVELPDGKMIHLDVVDHAPAVTLIPIDEEGQVWFVRQYRHPAGEELLELPAGVVEKDEEPEAGALREVREEIGMSAGSLQKVAEYYLAPGYSSERMFVYLARDLKPSPLPGDEDEFLSIEKIPLDMAIAMAETGGLRDVKTIASLLLARPYYNAAPLD